MRPGVPDGDWCLWFVSNLVHAAVSVWLCMCGKRYGGAGGVWLLGGLVFVDAGHARTGWFWCCLCGCWWLWLVTSSCGWCRCEKDFEDVLNLRCFVGSVSLSGVWVGFVLGFYAKSKLCQLEDGFPLLCRNKKGGKCLVSVADGVCRLGMGARHPSVVGE